MKIFIVSRYAKYTASDS